MKKVGEQLRLCREEKGISQGALADTASVGKRTLCAIENGYRNCSMSVMNKLLECLEISWADFFSRVMLLPDDFEVCNKPGKKPAAHNTVKVNSRVDLDS